jgi:chromosome partitioning protein
MLKVAVFNFKGGTGKSTTTLNLGAALARTGLKTLVIDLDGQRTLSFGLGLDGQEPTALDWLSTEENTLPVATQLKNLFLIPGSIGMFRLTTTTDLFTPALNKLIPLDYDVIMMDCPPGLGIAAVQAILSSDRVLVPTLCEPAALKGLSEAVSLIRGEDQQKPIEVLRTRHKPRLVLGYCILRFQRIFRSQSLLLSRFLSWSMPAPPVVQQPINHLLKNAANCGG